MEYIYFFLSQRKYESLITKGNTCRVSFMSEYSILMTVWMMENLRDYIYVIYSSSTWLKTVHAMTHRHNEKKKDPQNHAIKVLL